MSLKPIINEAFKLLRSEGIRCKQNYLCCSNCAISDHMASPHRDMSLVYYHRQDGEYLRSVKPDPREWFMIRYTTPCNSEESEAVSLGHKIVAAFNTVGAIGVDIVEVKWDGDPNTCIQVRVKN